ncbi:transcription termination factor 5, mitochondrial-like isoform X2 [Amphibalanus amphitrite]|uniref:transcription termination factor 5, mitochondrial-like isoform X2 n=1 Tax=Amphibalanus amphitrite TaxID=1232801 RepID=UPI001C8FC645|nr:transcription termination factor 5, mitochondrial-like isoform X2 [Amphibalanus amphitrite]
MLLCGDSNMPKITQTFPVVALQRLQKTYGVSRKCANVILLKQQEIREDDDYDVMSTLGLLHKWKLDLELVTRFPQILKRPPYALDHHKHILEECGITVGVSSLASYLKVNRSFLFALEAHGAIPAGHDVIGSLCRSVELAPAVEDTVRGSLGSVQSRTLLDVRLAVFQQYLRQRLDCDASDAEAMITKYPRNRHKSLRLTARILKLLEAQGLAAEKIVRNPYLLNTHPDQLEALLENCPTVASTDIREMLRKVPRIAYMPWHNTAQIVRIVEEFGFSEQTVLNGAEVFTLAADTVRERLALMAEIPELWAMRHNKNFFKMVFSFQRTLNRLSYMRTINMRCLSVHLLSTFYPMFRRYVSTGEDRTGGADLATYLSERLSVPAAEVWRQLRHHPHWRAVPLLTVSQTTEALLDAGFSAAQVRHALHLTLYPERRALEAARDAADAAVVPDEYVLQLALYRLEREGHFSGTGVFAFAADRPAVAVGSGAPAELPVEEGRVPRRSARVEGR